MLWIPACAGMTEERNFQRSIHNNHFVFEVPYKKEYYLQAIKALLFLNNHL